MKLLWGPFAAALGVASPTGSLTAADCVDAKPQVDLGYAVHQATIAPLDDYYTFKNIRYGDAPVDKLRFKESNPVSATNRTVNDGSIGFKCPQAYPEWALTDIAAAANVSTDVMSQMIINDPLVSEDCLFLDVVVPQKAFNQDDSYHGEAPVLVWFHGGGYVFGAKDDAAYDPAGIISRSLTGDDKGVIFVAVNYRLGLFGWLNGLSDDSILANVGLHDQRLALDWVKKYIEQFGGNPDSVTVLGESAGAGSIIHHITANGGGDELPFQRAIIQSPGWEDVDVEEVWTTTLNIASTVSGKHISSGDDLAALDYKTLNQINGAVIFASSNGSFTFSPSVDQQYVPDYPENLLLEGHFNTGPEIMIGHNANEAGLFVSPSLDTEQDLIVDLSHVFHKLDDSRDYILRELYPPPAQSGGLYKNNYERACLIISESSFVCHTRSLAVAFGNNTYSYRFQVPPAVHAQDVPYTFFSGNASAASPELATAMQMYFTSFAKGGDPNALGNMTSWPEYSEEARILTFGKDGINEDEDDAKNKRCEFWERANYRK